MLDILNPCNNSSAWWQHLLMLGIPFLLGLLWAKGAGATLEDDGLAARLSALDANLAECQSNTRSKEASLKAEAATIPSPVVANPISAVGNLTTKSKKDDLKVVEGIGPKIEELFNNAGIFTFGELANTSASKLKEILAAAGSRYQMHDPTTWPAQSKLAEEGKWEELKKWQDELNKGTA
jgi:predicted flap endonuclease-1-like 5' DNA nuclease